MPSAAPRGALKPSNLVVSVERASFLRDTVPVLERPVLKRILTCSSLTRSMRFRQKLDMSKSDFASIRSVKSLSVVPSYLLSICATSALTNAMLSSLRFGHKNWLCILSVQDVIYG